MSGLVDLVVVDDEALTLEMVERRLAGTPHKILCFNDEWQAVNHLRDQAPRVLIVDQRMPHLDGIDLIEALGDALPPRTYLCSSVALPAATLKTAKELGVREISKDVLDNRIELLALLDPD